MDEPIPPSPTRVPEHTDSEVNRRLRERIHDRLHYYAAHPEEIDERLEQLDREWDLERTLEANASALGLGSLLLGAALDRRFYLLTGTVLGFLLQHAVQGWCPPIPFLRRLGFRTPREIEAERYALRVLRGDFEGVSRDEDGDRDGVHGALEVVDGGAQQA